jgi:hypothetical protein
MMILYKIYDFDADFKSNMAMPPIGQCKPDERFRLMRASS